MVVIFGQREYICSQKCIFKNGTRRVFIANIFKLKVNYVLIIFEADW